MPTATISKCSSCGYPITAEFIGQQVTCPMCSTVNEAITGVEVPSVIFWGGLGFLAGFLVAKSKVVGEKIARL